MDLSLPPRTRDETCSRDEAHSVDVTPSPEATHVVDESLAATTTVDLAALLERVALGDEAAFVDLYERTRTRTSSVVRRTLRCPHQSDEVVQEVYLEVWQRAGRFDASRGSALGWMSMVAHRRAVDRVRRVTTAAVRDDNDASRDVSDGGDVWTQVAARLDASHVRSALGRLSFLQREALCLTYLTGYSQRQAAELLAVPLGTLKSRIRDGLIVLRLDLDRA